MKEETEKIIFRSHSIDRREISSHPEFETQLVENGPISRVSMLGGDSRHEMQAKSLGIPEISDRKFHCLSRHTSFSNVLKKSLRQLK